MERTLITSSNVKAVEYDEENEILTVEFNRGDVYSYIGVPQQVVDDLMEAESKGRFLNQNIMNVYDELRLTTKVPA